jgi:hypothetical protein
MFGAVVEQMVELMIDVVSKDRHHVQTYHDSHLV